MSDLKMMLGGAEMKNEKRKLIVKIRRYQNATYVHSGGATYSVGRDGLIDKKSRIWTQLYSECSLNALEKILNRILAQRTALALKSEEPQP